MSKDILFPLRRLHGHLHNWKVQRRREWRMWKYVSFPLGKKTYIPGTPEHTNLGDSAIVLAQAAFLQRCGFDSSQVKEITFSEYPVYQALLKRTTRQNSLITQLGGGNMGSQWIQEELFHRHITMDFPKNPMIMFPQTIFYTSDEQGQQEQQNSIPVYNGQQHLTLVAREATSFSIMQKLYPDTKLLLVPDIVLSADMNTFGAQPQQRKGVMLCMRSDAERAMTDELRNALEALLLSQGQVLRYTDMHSDCPVTKDNRADCVRAKMEEFLAAELVITDRLHGMIFAAITGTPCIVFSNYNHKVSGTYEWIKHLPYIRFAQTPEDVAGHLPELLAMHDCKYDNTPLLPYFEKLAEVVKHHAHH